MGTSSRPARGRAPAGARCRSAELPCWAPTSTGQRLRLPGRTIRVHAGDMAGVTPLVSSHFHDEPAIEAMNLMRFDVGTLGNHEFDEGASEALRLLRGGRRRDGRELKRDERGRLENTSAARTSRGRASPT